MTIRPVTPAEISRWVEMRSELWPEYTEDHPVELQQYFDGDAIDIEEAFFIESDVGEVTGFIEINIRDYAEGSRISPVPYIEAWYVKPEYRGQGYGKALMLFAEDWAVQRGFTELASDTEIDNERSIQFHKHLGYKETERIVCFVKQLVR